MEDTRERILNIPNLLTLLRIVSGFLFAIFLFLGFSNIVLFWIFIAGSITDFLDGFLARLLKQTTRFGKSFDAVADKAISALALFSLALYSVNYDFFIYFKLNLLLAIILIIPRDILGLIGFLITYFRKKENIVVKDFINKLGRFVQYITLLSIILNFNLSF